MMRRLSYGLLTVLLIAACGRKNEESSWDGPVMELSVSCLEANLTKAGSDGTEDGENSYHENLIEWVDFYFYPGDATSDQATYHIRKTSGKRDSDVFRIELTTNQVNYRIFPVLSGITEATVFAIANGPKDELDQLDDTSLRSIESLVVSTDFVHSSYTNRRQDNFMMRGLTTITLAGRSQKVVSQGKVSLERYASKITVGIKMDDRVETSSGEVWTPSPEEMKIYLVDGMKTVSLGGKPAGAKGGIVPTSEDYLDYKDKQLTFFNEDGEPFFDKDGDYYNTFPMYTYPYHWDSGAEHEPYLKLVMTWHRKAENGFVSTQKEFYYKILIPQDRRGGEFLNSFIRNNWYHYNINVGVLGADTDEDAVELQATMFILYWQDKDVVVKRANIGNARYLSVEGTEFEMYNQESLRVIYTTSSPAILKSIHVTRPYFGENPSEAYNSRYGADVKKVSYSDTKTYDDIYPEGSFYLDYTEHGGTEWLQLSDGVIVYTHPLVNDFLDERFDYSPYTITFAVSHADNTGDWDEYDKHVKIVQYPGIYIQATPNPDEIIDKGNQSITGHHGYVYINGDYQYSQEDYEHDGYREEDVWKVVTYNGGGTDMYRISATVLPSNSNFVIGDPRVSSENNLDFEFCTSYTVKKDVEGHEIADLDESHKRTLKWYYPTDGSDRTVNMIAPAYRVSTKLSGSARSTEITKESALKRCASFQENGFPAGRWRLPTQGEISFIATLSANGVFAKQFDNNYWSANGVVTVNNNKVTPNLTATKAFIRCVYDSWYWGDDRIVDTQDNPAIFAWGDAER